MAFEDHKGFIPPGLQAASLINPMSVVSLDTVADQVVPIATNNVRPLGVVGDASVAQGEAITVYGQHNIVKVKACASLGAGAEVGVGSTNGQLNAIAAASGVTRWAVGQSLSAAGAGEVFSLLVHPRQLGNQA